MPRRFVFLALIALVALAFSAWAQMPQNPILFVTVVPNALDSATQSATFCSHLTGVRNAPRGGDLWIRYPDGTLKNLTQLAGYGNDGVQADKSITVREPSVHWSGKKAVFSMVVGSPLSLTDQTKFYWQMYEITGLGKDETPVITKVPNQPQSNNVSPVYGTDGRIIFISDKNRQGNTGSYQYLDENITMVTNSGLWSLDPENGNLRHLDHSPSGSFSPIVDSYGRILFSRWDFLQQDQMNNFSAGGVTYSNESPTSPFSSSSSSQAEFPEFNAGIQFSQVNTYYKPPSDTIPPSLIDPHCPSNFFPWAVNEDGSNAQTINHIGRHELLASIPSNDSTRRDGNLIAFDAATSSRANKNPIINCLTMKEDPNSPGSLYGIDAVSALNHSGGQIIRINKVAPTDASNQATVSYITPRSTRSVFTGKNTTDPNTTGFYRNPLPTTNGVLIASYSSSTTLDNIPPLGTINVNSRHNYRLKTLKQSNNYMVHDQYLTNGITKSLVINDFRNGTSNQITFSGLLWEMDPVEVVARPIPSQHTEAAIDPLEQAVFDEEHVDVPTFRKYLQEKNQALIVSRDITMRDKDDKQQPFYLRVNGTSKQTSGAIGSVYDVSHLTIFQADYLRAYSPQQKPSNGRRVVPVRMHDGSATNGNVPLQNDASFAALVPAERALSWQLSDPNGKAVVRERYWVTFKAGEIRACVKCHGENGEASVLANPTPQNKSEGLRNLLHTWKISTRPARVKQSLPSNLSRNTSFPINFLWEADPNAQQYEVIVKAYEGTDLRVIYTKTVDAPTTSFILRESDVQTTAKQFQWEVRAIGKWGGVSETVYPFNFSTDGVLSVSETGESPQLQLEPNPASGAVRLHFSLNESSSYSIVLTDMLGRDVMMNNYIASGQEVDAELQLNSLVQGVYMVRVQYAGGEYRKRLVVSR